jgi:hypothetical protein
MVKHRDPLERIAALKQKSEQIAAQLKALETRNAASVKKSDTRRTILLGACVISALETDSNLRGYVQKKLDKFLTRERDRELFADLLNQKES